MWLVTARKIANDFEGIIRKNYLVKSGWRKGRYINGVVLKKEQFEKWKKLPCRNPHRRCHQWEQISENNYMIY